jgi:2-hydroxycyclohexanecarboxyl-CoA dehydrogenase
MRGLKGKAVIVTGAGGAIGGAIASRFVEAGAVVGIFDKNGEAARTAAGRVGHGAIPVACDITDYSAVGAAVAAFEAKAGPTHALVNNAGWDKFAFFLETEPPLWDQLIAINLKGPINMHHVVLKGMAQRRAGRIVNIASDAGRVGSTMEAVYSACKGGIISFTKTMAREMARAGVTLNAVCPGPTDTPLLATFMGEGEKGKKIHDALLSAIPMKRLGRPEDIAGIVVFLASDEAAYITGQVISASGGLTMAG